MAFDIHGNDLEKGFCEVHPYVKQEYPCRICLQERKEKNVKKINTQIPKGKTNRVVIDTFIQRINTDELKNEFIDINFDGQAMIQIRQHPSGSHWEVSNAMDGYGHNRYEDFKDFKVIFLED